MKKRELRGLISSLQAQLVELSARIDALEAAPTPEAPAPKVEVFTKPLPARPPKGGILVQQGADVDYFSWVIRENQARAAAGRDDLML